MVEFFRKSSAEVSSTHSKKMVTLMLETDTRHFGDKKKLTTVSAFSHQHALSFFHNFNSRKRRHHNKSLLLPWSRMNTINFDRQTCSLEDNYRL